MSDIEELLLVARSVLSGSTPSKAQLSLKPIIQQTAHLCSNKDVLEKMISGGVFDAIRKLLGELDEFQPASMFPEDVSQNVAALVLLAQSSRRLQCSDLMTEVLSYSPAESDVFKEFETVAQIMTNVAMLERDPDSLPCNSEAYARLIRSALSRTTKLNLPASQIALMKLFSTLLERKGEFSEQLLASTCHEFFGLVPTLLIAFPEFEQGLVQFLLALEQPLQDTRANLPPFWTGIIHDVGDAAAWSLEPTQLQRSQSFSRTPPKQRLFSGVVGSTMKAGIELVSRAAMKVSGLGDTKSEAPEKCFSPSIVRFIARCLKSPNKSISEAAAACLASIVEANKATAKVIDFVESAQILQLGTDVAKCLYLRTLEMAYADCDRKPQEELPRVVTALFRTPSSQMWIEGLRCCRAVAARESTNELLVAVMCEVLRTDGDPLMEEAYFEAAELYSALTLDDNRKDELRGLWIKLLERNAAGAPTAAKVIAELCDSTGVNTSGSSTDVLDKIRIADRRGCLMVLELLLEMVKEKESQKMLFYEKVLKDVVEFAVKNEDKMLSKMVAGLIGRFGTKFSSSFSSELRTSIQPASDTWWAETLSQMIALLENHPSSIQFVCEVVAGCPQTQIRTLLHQLRPHLLRTSNFTTPALLAVAREIGFYEIFPDLGLSPEQYVALACSLDSPAAWCQILRSPEPHHVQFACEGGLVVEGATNGKLTIGIWFRFHCATSESSVSLLEVLGNRVLIEESALHLERGDLSYDIISPAIPELSSDRWLVLVVSQNATQTIFYLNGRVAGTVDTPLIPNGDFTLLIGSSKGFNQGVLVDINSVRVWSDSLSVGEVAFATFGRLALPSSERISETDCNMLRAGVQIDRNLPRPQVKAVFSSRMTQGVDVINQVKTTSGGGFTARMSNPVFLPFPFQIDLPGLFISCRGMEELLRWLDDESFPLSQSLKIASFALNSRAAVLWQVSFVQRLCLTLKVRCREIVVQDVDNIFGMVASIEQWDDPLITSSTGFATLFGDFSLWGNCNHAVVDKVTQLVLKCISGKYSKRNAHFLRGSGFSDVLLHSLYRGIQSRLALQRGFEILKNCYVLLGNQVQHLISSANVVSQALQEVTREGTCSLQVKSRLSVELSINETTTLIANTLLMLLEIGGISLTNFSTAFTTEWFVAVFCYAGHSVVAALALNLLIRIMLSPHGSTLRSGVARNITRIVSALNNHVRQPLLLMQLLAGVVGVALNIVKTQPSIEAQVIAAVNGDGIGQTSISPLFLSTLVAHVRVLALSHGWCEPDISVDTFCRYRPLPKWKKLLSVLRLRTAFTPFGRKTERWAVVRICLQHLKTIVGKPEWFGALVASPTSLQALDRLINWCPDRCLPALSLDSSQGNAAEPTSPGSPHDFDFGVSVQPPLEVAGAMGSSAPLSGSFILSTQREEDLDTTVEADEGKDFDDLRSQLSVTISASSEEEISEVSDLADDIYGFTKEFFRIAVKSLNRNAYVSLLMGIDFLAGKESRQATKSIRVSHSGLTAALQSTFGEQITAAIEVFCGHVVNSYIAKQVDFKTCASILLHIFGELEETGPPPIVASELTRLCFTRLLDPKPFAEDISALKKALEAAFVGQAALATCGVYLIMKTGCQLYGQNQKSTELEGLFQCMKLLCRAAGPQAVKSALRSKGLIRSTDHATPFLEAMHSGTNAFWSWAAGDPQILNTMRVKCASQIQNFTANQAIEIKRLQESARSLAESSPMRQANSSSSDTGMGVLCDYFPPRSTVLKELSLREAQLSWLPIRCSTGPGRVGEVHYLDRYNNIVSVETEFSSIGDNLTHSDIAAMTSDDNITPLGVIVPGCVCAFPPNRESFSALPANLKRISDSAVSFLRRLLRSNEPIKAIENGFLVRGLTIVPSLVLLTTTSLRLISNIELLPDGNILASQLEHAPTSRGASTFSAMNLVSGWIAPLGTLAARMTQRRQPDTPLTRTDLKRVQEAHTKTLRRLHATSYADDKTHLVFEYPVLNIKEARPAVFQHHPAAIEVLLDMAQGVYFALVDEAMNFSKETRNKFLEVMKEMGITVHEGFEKLTESKRQKWQHHQISTFDYLQYLNEAAGRRQADFSQYPVMPWILRGDIPDDLLNLENPLSFRNLRRPMGAQTEESIKKALERFQMATEMERESPNEQAFSDICHYSTHYSTAAGVLYFFLRVQPHNSHIRTLQGGKLDHADRMFHSVEASWKAAIEIDGKELVPELFHCHQLLTNRSGAPLGTRQNGDSIDDVKLPRWAKSSMHFALCMRLALESDFVSKEIPCWIDLVFGSKQRGEDAMNALNVYHPSSYSELVFKALGKSAHACDEIVSRVENFGQTPKQLFTVEHPPREPLAKQSRVLGFSLNFAAVMAIDVNTTRPVVASDDPCIVQLLPTSQGIIASPARCYVTGRLNDIAITWNATDITRRAVKDGSFLADQFYFSPPCGGRITTVLFGRFEALGIVGTTTGMLYVLARDSDGNMLQKAALVGHRHPVAGVVLASRLGMLVSFTNSADDPPLVWRTFRQRTGFISELQKSNLSVIDVAVNDSSGHIAAVSAKELHLYFRSGELLGVGQSAVEAAITCVAAFNTLEWCNGLSLYLTGHADGSVSLWHCQLNVSGEPLCSITLKTNIKIRSGATPVTKIHVGVDSLVMTLGFKDGRVSAFTLPHAELEKLGIHRERTGNLSISGAST